MPFESVMESHSVSTKFSERGWFRVVPELKSHLCADILVLANSFKGPVKNVLIWIINENNHEHSGLKIARGDALFLIGRRSKDINEMACGETVPSFGGDDLAVFERPFSFVAGRMGFA